MRFRNDRAGLHICALIPVSMPYTLMGALIASPPTRPRKRERDEQQPRVMLYVHDSLNTVQAATQTSSQTIRDVVTAVRLTTRLVNLRKTSR